MECHKALDDTIDGSNIAKAIAAGSSCDKALEAMELILLGVPSGCNIVNVLNRHRDNSRS